MAEPSAISSFRACGSRCVAVLLGVVGVLAVVGPRSAVASGPGSLDTSFGSGGVVTTDLGGAEQIAAIAIQSDQKIVAVGFTASGSSEDWAVVRYNPGGSLDTTFGAGGVVTTNLGGNDTAS